MTISTKYIGLDVHRDTISIAVADEARNREIRFFGTVANDGEALHKALTSIGKDGATLKVCYESGPCGFVIHRFLTKLGIDCVVISPSSMPRRPNDRVKTDRRDAQTLARLLRAGELTAVWVPDEAHEAIRDVVRARRQAKQELVSAKNTLKSFLLRHDRRFPGKAIWGRMHWRWLSDQRFAFPHQQFVYEEYKRASRNWRSAATAWSRCWPLAPIVTALQALRGIKFIAAVTLVAAIGDLHRFDSPKQLMAWLGLVPAEHSSGTRTRRGELTRTGNAAARAILIESAWQYRYPAREGRALRERNARLPDHIRAIAWKAQTRLCAKFLLRPSALQATKMGQESNASMSGMTRDVFG
ncbi:IS110 family transposase [Chelativorans xinjiangense]|uniref:IS110 family transposase n=1 Tax=Chelativorans xinjiangense TaxID=2681485 RepID=UPI00135BA88B|nr:IS110 family transposase [Chelativorans xinjiangense]